MSCDANLLSFPLPATYKGCTWDGLSWAVTSDDTEFAAVLSSARFQLQDSTGAAVLTLTSATAGQVTLNTTTGGSWDITVEPRILSVTAGTYFYALETTDADGIIKPQMMGTLQVRDEPIL